MVLCPRHSASPASGQASRSAQDGFCQKEERPKAGISAATAVLFPGGNAAVHLPWRSVSHHTGSRAGLQRGITSRGWLGSNRASCAVTAKHQEKKANSSGAGDFLFITRPAGQQSVCVHKHQDGDRRVLVMTSAPGSPMQTDSRAGAAPIQEAVRWEEKWRSDWSSPSSAHLQPRRCEKRGRSHQLSLSSSSNSNRETQTHPWKPFASVPRAKAGKTLTKGV